MPVLFGNRANASNTQGPTQAINTVASSAPANVLIHTYPRPSGQLIVMAENFGNQAMKGAIVERDSDGGFWCNGIGVPPELTNLVINSMRP